MAGESDWLPYLLQTADALFPTGGYAHSLGFEEAVSLGMVRDEKTLLSYLRLHMVPALREHELPYLRFAYQAAKSGDLPEFRRINAEIDAWKLAPETREASIQLGTRRLRSLRGISDHPFLICVDRFVSSQGCRGHHLAICGLQSLVESIPLNAALITYFYQSLAATCGAALKLIRVGQEAGQRSLREAVKAAAESVERSMEVSRPDAGWFTTAVEIASLRHARSYERLFIS